MLQFQEIQTIINAFYAKATSDVIIGYHFRHIADFDQHLPRIACFWEIQLTGQGQEFGRRKEKPFNLLAAHLPLGIKKAEIRRWVILFKATVDESPLEDSVKKLWHLKLDFFQHKFLTLF